MTRLDEMRASSRARATSRSIAEADSSADPRTRSLAAEERALRDSIASVSMAGAGSEHVEQLQARLAETLYELAMHTAAPTQVDRALFHWRENFDAIAQQIGENTARTRISELEALLSTEQQGASGE